METLEIILFVVIFVCLFGLSRDERDEDLESRVEELENNWEEKFGTDNSSWDEND